MEKSVFDNDEKFNELNKFYENNNSIYNKNKEKYSLSNGYDLSSSHKSDEGGTKNKHEKGKIEKVRGPPVKSISTTMVVGQVDKNNVNKILYDRDCDPFAIKPDNCETFEELLNAVLDYAEEELYRSDETVKHYRRYARLMSNTDNGVDNPFPIDFFNLNFRQFRLHMKWYKQNYYDKETGKNYYGLKHRKDVVDAFLQAYGLPDHPWNKYHLPPQPKRKEVMVLEPETVQKFFHFNGYDEDKEINRYWQYIFFFGFMLGVRPPSELWMMQIDHLYDLKRPYIRVIEKKKHYSTRPLYLPNPLMHAKTRKSFYNFYFHIRPKFVASDYHGNKLFVSPYTGKPWEYSSFGKSLRQKGKLVDERYHPYCMRHTAAISYITHKWQEKHVDPIRWVSVFLGHDCKKTTEERYLQHAEEYYDEYNFDWVKRALKFPEKWREESTLKSKQWQKTYVSNGIPPVGEYGPAEICIGQQEGFLGEFLEKNKLWFFNAIQFISLKLFFFSFSGFVRILIFNFYFSDSQNFEMCKEEYGMNEIKRETKNKIKEADERVKVKIPLEDILGHTEYLEYITDRKGSAFLKEQISPFLSEETQPKETIENLTFLDGVLLTWNIFNRILDKRLKDENGEPEQGISEGYSYDYLGIINDDVTSLLWDKVLEHGYLKSRGGYLSNQFGVNIG